MAAAPAFSSRRRCAATSFAGQRIFALHRVFDRVVNLPLEAFVTWPFQASGSVSFDAEEREHPLGRAERAIAEVVVHLAVGVAVGVATVAAHPAVVRESGVVEQQLASLGERQFGLRAERDRGGDRSLGQIEDRNRVVERVGDEGRCAVG